MHSAAGAGQHSEPGRVCPYLRAGQRNPRVRYWISSTAALGVLPVEDLYAHVADDVATSRESEGHHHASAGDTSIVLRGCRLSRPGSLIDAILFRPSCPPPTALPCIAERGQTRPYQLRHLPRSIPSLTSFLSDFHSFHRLSTSSVPVRHPSHNPLGNTGTSWQTLPAFP